MIFFDSHIHIYPEYSLDRLFSGFVANSRRFAKRNATDVSLAMAVQLRDFQRSLESVLGEHKPAFWRIVSLRGGVASVTDGTDTITVLAARQIAARERIEVLGFFGETHVPDGLPLDETIRRVRDASMTPAIAWGLGKWLGKRGKIVRNLIETTTSPLLIADSALRPAIWPEPLYGTAIAHGLRFVYGSDPLPGKPDESLAGRYAMLVDADLDTTDPASSLLASLTGGNVVTSPCGRRHGIIETIGHIK